MTQEGLNRYTGHELENYRYSASNSSSLPTNAVTGVAEDKDGTLWVSTRGKGLATYDPASNAFNSLPADPNDRNTPWSNDIYSIFTDSQGKMWLGYANGFSIFDPKESIFRHFIAETNNAVPLMGSIYSFTETASGHIWAATEKGGLLQISANGQEIQTHAHSPNNPASIAEGALYRVITDKFGKIWIASALNGVSRFDPITHFSKNFEHISSDLHSLSSNKTSDVFEDIQGNIWIATSEGLNLYRAQSGRFDRYTTHNTSLPGDGVLSVYQTREGMYWVGTRTGIASGFRAHFNKYNRSTNQLSGNSVNAFAETSDGSLWVATDDGLNRLRPNTDTFEWINESTDPAISSSTVMSLYADQSTVWIGTFDGGLNKLNLNTNQVEIFKHNPLDETSIGANGITSILRSSSGLLLIGTFGGGLNLYDAITNTFQTFKNEPGNPRSLSNNMILTLFEDSLGNIWVGTEKGLNHFSLENFTFQRFAMEGSGPNSISSPVIWSLFEDTQQNLWLGSGGGGLINWPLASRRHFEPAFIEYSDIVDLPSHNIYGIQQDGDGWLWFSHNKGLTRLDPISKSSHHFGVRDGLQAAEFNLGASFKSKQGTMYFGGIAGFNSISPSELSWDRVPPKIAISEIKIMDQRRNFGMPYDALKTITLGYEDRMLSVEFFAADYANPDLVNYAYKLEGINPDWIISPESRVASFTTLPPGKYTLKLAAASPDGTWNWNGRSLPIVVEAPPWRSPIAYAIYILLGLAVVAYYFYMQRKKALLAAARQRELELRVEERTRDLNAARKEAEEATKAKSDFLATMTHEIRTPMHGIIGMTELLLHTNLSAQQQQFTKAAHKSGESLLILINEILDFSKVEASKVELEAVEFDIFGVIEDICYLQAEPATKKGLSLNHICDPQLSSTMVGDPTKLRQVIMNLVSNSIKFTHEGNINVRAMARPINTTSDKVMLHICVEDDGIGMDSATQSKVFEPFTQADTSTTREYGGTGLGLSISRNYIDLMGGDINVSSEPGKGSKITISVPLIVIEEPLDQKQPTANPKVCVYGDNSATIEMVSTILKRVGMSPEKFTSDTLLSERPPENSIIIFDGHALEANKKVSSVASELENATKIVLTSFAQDLPLLSLSGWSRITKPVLAAELLDLVQASVEYRDDLQKGFPNAHGTQEQEPLRILVAEDVETNQRIVLEMLQLLQYKVDIAENGQVAVEKFQSRTYALILMDCQMPIIDGYRASQQIREIEKSNGAARTPIVALTAGSDDKDVIRCEEAGMDGYLTKPFTLSDIDQALKGFLEQPNLKNIEETVQPRVNPAANSPPQHSNSVDSEIMNDSAIESIREVERQTGKELLPTIFGGYCDQMIPKLTEIDLNLNEGDSDAFYRTAHAIKSMSANIGAERVKSISAGLESLGRSGDIAESGNSIRSLKEAYKEFVLEFETNILTPQD